MKQLLIANPNILKSDVQPETPSKVLVAPKGQRGKLAPQKPGESFAQFQARLAEARAERAERSRRYRARIKAKVVERAELVMQVHEVDQEQAVHIALSALPERVGVGIRLDVQAALTTHFKRGFSHRRGNVRNNFLSSRLLNSLNQYRAMQLGKIHGPNGQLNISRANPLYRVCMVDRSSHEHHTPNFGANAFVSGCTIQERLQGAETRALRKHDPLAVYSAHTQQEMLKWFEALDRKANPQAHEQAARERYQAAWAKEQAKPKVDTRPLQTFAPGFWFANGRYIPTASIVFQCPPAGTYEASLK